MKKTILITLLGVLTMNLFAQKDETIFNRSNRVGFFLSTGSDFGINNKDFNSTVNGGGAIILGDMFIGAYGTAGANFDQLIWDEEIRSIDLAHGGLWLGFNAMQHKMLHPIASVKVGWGAVDINFDELENYDFDPESEESWNIRDNDALDNVFVSTPEIGLELNLTRFLRVSGTVGYRWVKGVDAASRYDVDSFDGVLGNVTLKLGWFGKNRSKNSWKWRW